MQECRYERKFLLPGLSVEDVVLDLKLLSAAFSEIYWLRRVNSLYLDTSDLDFASENFVGSPTKTKTRIRWYGDDLHKANNPKFEIKAKQGSVGSKISFDLPDLDFSQGITSSLVGDALLRSDIPENYKIKLSLLEPTLITFYNRRYFLSKDALFRVTVDFDLCFYTRDFRQYIPRHYENTILLELKYREEFDLKARNLLGSLPYRLTKSSKYISGLQEIWGL